jgi:hypothetical protein
MPRCFPAALALRLSPELQQAFQAALNAVACGQIVNVASAAAGVTIAYGAQQIPNNVICTPTTYVWVTRDLSDTTFPADGVRPDPSYAGIPNTAMPMYPYPGANPTPGVGARHMPQIIVPASNNNPCFRFSIPGGANTPSIAYWRIQGFQCTRDQSADALTALISLDYQPNAAGQDCEISNGLPVHADKCAADQPNHLVISQNVIHGDAQRQTVRAISMGGGQFIAVVNNYIYDIQDSYAGGQGDAQAIAGGFGRGYTGVGNWIFKNNQTSSSTEGQIFCGAYVEPASPVTGKDGIPTSVIWDYDWFFKNFLWDTQRGQPANETLVNEGQIYPPVGDQEQVWSTTAFQVQQGLAFTLDNTWLNDSAGGWNRFSDVGGTGTVTVDGVDYKTINSANGIVTRAFLTVGSNPWQCKASFNGHTSPASETTIPWHRAAPRPRRPDRTRWCSTAWSLTAAWRRSETIATSRPPSPQPSPPARRRTRSLSLQTLPTFRYSLLIPIPSTTPATSLTSSTPA